MPRIFGARLTIERRGHVAGADRGSLREACSFPQGVRRRQQADSAREDDISGIGKSLLAKAFRDLTISPHVLKITAIVKYRPSGAYG
jgi:hypothetical protein